MHSSICFFFVIFVYAFFPVRLLDLFSFGLEARVEAHAQIELLSSFRELQIAFSLNEIKGILHHYVRSHSTAKSHLVLFFQKLQRACPPFRFYSIMPTDMLSLVFCFLDLMTMVKSVFLVCRSFRYVALLPSSWFRVSIHNVLRCLFSVLSISRFFF